VGDRFFPGLVCCYPALDGCLDLGHQFRFLLPIDPVGAAAARVLVPAALLPAFLAASDEFLGRSALWLAMLYYFDRERPAQIVFGMPGYPSGHAMSMFTYYAVLLYIFFLPLIRRRLFRRLSALWLLWALLNGYSRLFLDVHYPTDVAAGYAIGMAWLGLAMLILPLPVRPPPLDDPVRPEDLDVDE
jgi:membrane-associated phospholipid phosphatase